MIEGVRGGVLQRAVQRWRFGSGAVLQEWVNSLATTVLMKDRTVIISGQARSVRPSPSESASELESPSRQRTTATDPSERHRPSKIWGRRLAVVEIGGTGGGVALVMTLHPRRCPDPPASFLSWPSGARRRCRASLGLWGLFAIRVNPVLLDRRRSIVS